MKTYRIEWKIDIEADSPMEAAQIARGYQLDRESIATVFDVIEMDFKTVHYCDVDTLEQWTKELTN